MKNVKLFSTVVVTVLFFVISLTSCDGGGLPNGRYEPALEQVAKMPIQAIIIDGNNFTTVMPMGGFGITAKYKYTDGTITFTDGAVTKGIACEYKNDTLYVAGIPFVK